VDELGMAESHAKAKTGKNGDKQEKEAAWELAIPVEGVCSRRSKEP
jgi:hypothetical protein